MDCDPCGPGVTNNCATPQPCSVNAIGQNTFGSNGIAPGQVGTLVVTAGDAKRFRPKRLYFQALPWSSPELIDPTARPPGTDSLPLFLVDAMVGRKSQLRRVGQPNLGLTQSAYANSKELELIDWDDFTSTNEHTLNLQFFNPNANTPVHVAATLWGDI